MSFEYKPCPSVPRKCSWSSKTKLSSGLTHLTPLDFSWTIVGLFFDAIQLRFLFFLKNIPSGRLLCPVYFIKNRAPSSLSQIQNLPPLNSLSPIWGQGCKICPLSCTVAHTTSSGSAIQYKAATKDFSLILLKSYGSVLPVH